MRKQILILLDSPEIRREVTTYSVELARRMEARLCLLMLLRWGGAAGQGDSVGTLREHSPICKKGERALKACLEEIRGYEVEVEGGVRQGDPSSELLKYLAESRPFHAVVWGGNEVFVRRRHTPVRSHWLERVREELDSPLVVPFLKRKQGGGGSVHNP